MVVIDRLHLKEELGYLLQQEYVALLGQSGSDIQVITGDLVRKSPLPKMNFISIVLPGNIDEGEEFERMFLERLCTAIEHIPSEQTLAQDIRNMLHSFYLSSTANTRLRATLDYLGQKTKANYVVLILHILANVKEKPLAALLTMLREYHREKDVDGASGRKIRILAEGEIHLWRLCHDYNPERSPFNIAKLYYLDGLSCSELQFMGICDNVDACAMLRDLTDGVPTLIKELIESKDKIEDLSVCFKHLRTNWDTLSLDARNTLRDVSCNSIQFPECQPDDRCPYIPDIEGSWQELFWKGFLRMRYRQLAWKSPLHQAFVVHIIQGQSLSISALLKSDLTERAKRLEKALTDFRYRRDRYEPFEEAILLASQVHSSELIMPLEMLRQGERNKTVLQKLTAIATASNSEWLERLVSEAVQHEATIGLFLIKSVLERVKIFVLEEHLYISESLGAIPQHLLVGVATNQLSAILSRKIETHDYDVFFSYNPTDRDIILKIVEQLKKQGILPWFDALQRPGFPQQSMQEEQIRKTKSAAVFVGKNGVAPWQQIQTQTLLTEFVNRGCPVIPVILGDVPNEQVPDFPSFLQVNVWVDFRKSDPDPMKHLLFGITGDRKWQR